MFEKNRNLECKFELTSRIFKVKVFLNSLKSFSTFLKSIFVLNIFSSWNLKKLLLSSFWNLEGKFQLSTFCLKFCYFSPFPLLFSWNWILKLFFWKLLLFRLNVAKKIVCAPLIVLFKVFLPFMLLLEQTHEQFLKQNIIWNSNTKFSPSTRKNFETKETLCERWKGKNEDKK